MKNVVRWATEQDWYQIETERPLYTVRAKVLDVGGDILAAVGYFVMCGNAVVFGEVKEAARKYPKTIVKAGKEMVLIASKTGLPVIANPDETVESAQRYLARLGFEDQQNGLWLWRGFPMQ